MNKIKNLLKGSPIAMVVAGLLVAGIASAAILTIYGKLIGKATVEQSVLVDGKSYTEETPYTIGQSSAIAGNTYTNDFLLENKSETTAPIKFATRYAVTGVHDWWDSEAGVTTRYYAVLPLDNKDSTTWAPISGDTMKGTLTYGLVSPEFNYKLEAEGLTPNKSYSLIYYADRQDRFENWGGDNPGALIAEFTTDGDGNISEEGSKNLVMNLPHANDWNGTADANYCVASDNYWLCRGAKIWLVLSSDYHVVDKKLIAWNPANYLFETDLITYDDSDTDGKALYLGKGKIKVYVDNSFAVDLVPGEYQVKTEVAPVQ